MRAAKSVVRAAKIPASSEAVCERYAPAYRVRLGTPKPGFWPDFRFQLIRTRIKLYISGSGSSFLKLQSGHSLIIDQTIFIMRVN